MAHSKLSALWPFGQRGAKRRPAKRASPSDDTEEEFCAMDASSPRSSCGTGLSLDQVRARTHTVQLQPRAQHQPRRRLAHWPVLPSQRALDAPAQRRRPTPSASARRAPPRCEGARSIRATAPRSSRSATDARAGCVRAGDLRGRKRCVVPGQQRGARPRYAADRPPKRRSRPSGPARAERAKERAGLPHNACCTSVQARRRRLSPCSAPFRTTAGSRAATGPAPP